MSCGFAPPPLLLPGVPTASLPSVPPLPFKPSFDWSADLGLDINVPDVIPATPKVSLPSVPPLPDPLPTLSCPFDEAA